MRRSRWPEEQNYVNSECEHLFFLTQLHPIWPEYRLCSSLPHNIQLSRPKWKPGAPRDPQCSASISVWVFTVYVSLYSHYNIQCTHRAHVLKGYLFIYKKWTWITEVVGNMMQSVVTTRETDLKKCSDRLTATPRSEHELRALWASLCDQNRAAPPTVRTDISVTIPTCSGVKEILGDSNPYLTGYSGVS